MEEPKKTPPTWKEWDTVCRAKRKAKQKRYVDPNDPWAFRKSGHWLWLQEKKARRKPFKPEDVLLLVDLIGLGTWQKLRYVVKRDLIEWYTTWDWADTSPGLLHPRYKGKLWKRLHEYLKDLGLTYLVERPIEYNRRIYEERRCRPHETNEIRRRLREVFRGERERKELYVPNVRQGEAVPKHEE